MDNGQCVGVIVCKASAHGKHGPQVLRGYIAMLAVDNSYRKAGLGMLSHMCNRYQMHFM